MSPLSSFRFLSFLSMAILGSAISVAEIYKRPVITRVYQSTQYALADSNRADGDRVSIEEVATALAGLKPSYVGSMYRLEYNTTLTEAMICDFNTIRSKVLAASPNAKFDVELNLDPHSLQGKPTYPNAAAVVSYMEYLNSKLPLDAWWFDFYSTAQKDAPDWVVAVTDYAHKHNQTVGGNVFGSVVPPNSDAVSFVDYKDSSSPYGFSIDSQQVKGLHHNATDTLILGHLNCNPQNGNTTESCVYMYNWNSTRRADYLDYWVSQQAPQNFTFMLPLFFPLCPGAYSFDPLDDYLPGDNTTLYDHIKDLAAKDK